MKEGEERMLFHTGRGMGEVSRLKRLGARERLKKSLGRGGGRGLTKDLKTQRPHCKKKSMQCTPNMVCYVCPVWNTLYGVKLRQIFGVCFTPNWVCFHQLSVLSH